MRILLRFLVVAMCSFANNAIGDALDSGRLAVIHTNQSVLVDDDGQLRSVDFLKRLWDAGIQMIGRYYGRCLEPAMPRKLLVNGGMRRDSEAQAILNAGFSLVSFYQYKTSDNTALLKFTSGLSEVYDPTRCEHTEYATSHPVSRSAADEGALDAQAAVAQAHAVHQPPNTPIYFGMDFNYTAGSNPVLDAGIITYFKVIREELSKPANRYLVGAYGDGEMLSVLLGQNEKYKMKSLIDFTWLSPSRSYPGTPKFTRSGPWNVLHSLSDSTVIYTPVGVCLDFVYDGDIQNKLAGFEYFGAWNRSGRAVMNGERTRAIYDQHRYICDTRNVNRGAQLKSCRDHRAPLPCDAAFCSARVVRVKPQNGESFSNVAIDLFGYAKFDGYAPLSSLSPSLAVRPHYSTDPNKITCE